VSECLNGDLRVRVNELELKDFITFAPARTGKPYQVLIREIMSAFNDGRLRITPTEEQKATLKHNTELYSES
jgi:hypothetical protein